MLLEVCKFSIFDKKRLVVIRECHCILNPYERRLIKPHLHEYDVSIPIAHNNGYRINPGGIIISS